MTELNSQEFNDKLTYRLPYHLTSRDTDMFSRLSLGFLVNMFVQSAMSANATIGFGFDDIRKQNLFWLFSRLTVEFDKTHLWRESGEVLTWIKCNEKFIYLRDFLVLDESKNVVAKATSNWVPVDLIAKRPKMVGGLDERYFVSNKEALSYAPEKLFPLKDPDETFERKAVFFDMDLNRHVSSYRYADWMMDTFPLDFHENHYPKKVSINFLNESNAGENLMITKKRSSQTSHMFEGLNESLNSNTFRAIIYF